MMPRVLARLGVAGCLGLLMLGGSAWVALSWLPVQRMQADELGSQARRLRHEMLAAATPAQGAQAQTDRTPDEAWQTLWQGLPLAGERVGLQTAVLRAARDQGLQVSAVQYRGAIEPWSAQAGAVLWRQRMVMPVEGAYPAVRAWVATLLAERALSIDAIDVQRPDVMGDQVKAQVSVSLWWRKPQGGTP